MPDPSRGGDHARGFALGAKTVQPAGYSVAMSPLLLVMPRAAAARTPAFGKAGWRLLLPRSAGGPAAVPAGMRGDLPDPSQSAAGMARPGRRRPPPCRGASPRGRVHTVA